MLVGQLNLHTNLILRLRHKAEVGDDNEGLLDRVIGAGDAETEFVEDQIGARTSANLSQHIPNIGSARQEAAFGLLNVPTSCIELASL